MYAIFFPVAPSGRASSCRALKERAMARDEFAAVTPGEMLKEEFLAKYGLS